MASASVNIKVIKPKPLKAGAMRQAYKDAAQKAADAMAEDMDKLTRYWHEPVKFIGKVTMHRNDIELTARPVSPKAKNVKRLKWINYGTKKDYPIPKPTNKSAKTLFFASRYISGSKPNSTAVGPSSSGPRDTRRKQVIHPGIRPRNWIYLRAREWRRTRKLKKFGLEATRNAVKVSGHKY